MFCLGLLSGRGHGHRCTDFSVGSESHPVGLARCPQSRPCSLLGAECWKLAPAPPPPHRHPEGQDGGGEGVTRAGGPAPAGNTLSFLCLQVHPPPITRGSNGLSSQLSESLPPGSEDPTRRGGQVAGVHTKGRRHELTASPQSPPVPGLCRHLTLTKLQPSTYLWFPLACESFGQDRVSPFCIRVGAPYTPAEWIQ